MQCFGNKNLQKRVLASVLALALGLLGIGSVAAAATYGKHTIISQSKFPVEGRDYVNFAIKNEDGLTYVNLRLATEAGVNNKRVYSTDGYFKDGSNNAVLAKDEIARSAVKTDVTALVNAAGYLETVTGMPTAAVPNVLVLATTDDETFNARCGSDDNADGYTYLSTYYISGLSDSNLSKMENVAAVIFVNSSTKETGPLTILPENGINPNNTSTLLHEYLHGLGISASGVSLATLVDKDGKQIACEGLQGVVKSDMAQYIYDIYDQPMSFADYTASVKVSEGEKENKPEEAKLALVKSVKLGKKDKTTPQAGYNYVYSEKSTEANGNESFAGLYFRGPNVDKVLNGAVIAWPNDTKLEAVPGIPLNCWEQNDEGGSYDLEISHLELQNSLMSHQNYRNWGVLMEAELAVLQDLGYDVNRRALYGSSLYSSGTAAALNMVINNNPYYELTADGKSYQTGVPSTVDNGIGLHIYGSNNEVTQAADLLTNGSYAFGTRIDGTNNHFIVAEDVKVAANGTEGAGVVVSWGMNHELDIKGTVEATGDGGKALRLDFGDNMLGNDDTYMGSYFVLMDGLDEESKTNKNDLTFAGPLVKKINISGTVKGGEAAIYMSPNAFVKDINILEGAAVSGDITNEWKHVTKKQLSDPSQVELVYNPEAKEDARNLSLDEYCPDLVTSINVAVGEGNVFTYKDDITGRDNTKLKVYSGEMAFTGKADLVNVVISEGAILSGAATLKVHDMESAMADGYSDDTTGKVINSGTIMPGKGTELGTISIKGQLLQTETGVLGAKFSAAGAAGRVEVDGAAVLDGNIALVPAQGYFAEDKEYRITAITADSFLGEYAASMDKSNEELSKLSPTLEVTAIKDAKTGEDLTDGKLVQAEAGEGQFLISVKRKANAYSSLAADDTTRGVGQVLDANVSGADEEWQPLYAALDFSGGTGAGLRNGLQQLSGGIYGSAALNSLDIHRTLNNMLLSLDTNAYSNGAEAFAKLEDETVIRHKAVVPFTKYTSLSDFTAHNSGVYGFADKMGRDGLLVGYHAAVNHSSVSGNSNGRSKGDGVYLGTQLRYRPAKWGKADAFGVARLAVEQERAHRRTTIGGWSGSTDEEYTCWSGSAKAGVEYGTKLKGFGALDYAFVHQPDINESGAVNRLEIDSKNYDSLRTQLGMKYTTAKKQLDNNSEYSTFLLSAWNHELLNKAGEQTMRFGTMEGSWTGKVKEQGRDSLTLGAGFTFHTPKKLDVTLMVGSDLYRKDGHSTYGKLGAEWKF